MRHNLSLHTGSMVLLLRFLWLLLFGSILKIQLLCVTFIYSCFMTIMTRRCIINLCFTRFCDLIVSRPHFFGKIRKYCKDFWKDLTLWCIVLKGYIFLIPFTFLIFILMHKVICVRLSLIGRHGKHLEIIIFGHDELKK